MKNYGLPYQGSKNRIIPWLINALPGADTFVDLFAGGCSVSHAAMLSGRFRHVIANDITDSAFVFRDALHGKFKNERRWISRDDFFRLKDTDAYARLCFSFGNDQRSYCYSKEIEPYKRAYHYAVCFDDWKPLTALCPDVVSVAKKVLSGKRDLQQRRIAFGSTVMEIQKSIKDKTRAVEIQNLEYVERLQSLQRLQSLECLVNLECLERLNGGWIANIPLEVSQKDYRDVAIPDNSVVYCDPPYKDTKKYTSTFDHDAFYGWCLDNPHPVFISEYDMPDGFTAIDATPIKNLMNSDKPVSRIEKLFVQTKFADRYQNPLLMF